MFWPVASGFALGGGLIIAIGAQNAFLLRQGLLRSHVFILCLIAATADAALIIAGVAGVGTLVQSNPTLLKVVTLGGAIFLTVYALQAAWRAWKPDALAVEGQAPASLGKAVSTLLAFTFLNPHVYLDTVVLVGGISAQYVGDARVAFAVGAVLASFVWFFSLGYGARLLTPLFAKPRAWQILDGIIAIIMALLALSLLQRFFTS
ncbi:LysE/ArgO family amino acid transporter [Ahrensia sp. R2A130]|uniref:LysE/ArgO family amino acid transporter n=1 Tax=Ahrensia sp. R2A130 TaxID=744979 RepID=UPI0035276E26